MVFWGRHTLPILVLVLAALACSLAPAVSPPLINTRTATPDPAFASTVRALPNSAAVLLNRPNTPIQMLIAQVEENRLSNTVQTLAGMYTRHVLSPNNDPNRGIGAARDWLLLQFDALRESNPAMDVWTQPFAYSWSGNEIVAENVVAVLPGTDIGAGVYVIGAHYDSITTDWMNGETYAPGANDNASGVAAVLEIARVLAPRTNRATLIFVAFASEETGRQGSIAFAKDYLQAQRIDVRGMINLDIIGSEMGANGEIDRRTIRLFSTEPNDSPSRHFARQVAQMIRTHMPEVNPALQNSEDRQGRWGDQMSFTMFGYPAMRIIQGLEDTSRQHSRRDTVDGVQPAYLAQSTRAALVAVASFAGGLPAPDGFTIRLRNGVRDAVMWNPVPGAAGYMVALRQPDSLYFDQVFPVDSAELSSLALDQFATIAVATLDENGVYGAFSAEISAEISIDTP
jgi:acetylornithine deacetylase/succinyl-diaminopimelate desuccinylase-like protein